MLRIASLPLALLFTVAVASAADTRHSLPAAAPRSVAAAPAKTAVPAMPEPATSAGVEALRILPGLAWPVVVLVLIGILAWSEGGRKLMRAVAWRLRAGAGVKIGSFYLASIPIRVEGSNTPVGGIPKSQVFDDRDGFFSEQRAHLAQDCRNFFIVHRLRPSDQPDMLYDVLVYLAPWKDATPLTGIRQVEYHFGPNWANKVFVSRDRANSFSIATSAWGSFVCIARLLFSDGHTAVISRLIDFEMGQIGNATDKPKEEKRVTDAAKEDGSDARRHDGWDE
jgi:hypothetical protein